MNTTSPTPSTQSIPTTAHTPSVVMGRSNYLATLFHLIAMEIYKIRRRKLSIVLIAIVVGIMLLLFIATSFQMSINQNRPPADYALPLCSQATSSYGCVTHQQTQTELIQAKKNIISIDAEMLVPPNLLAIIMSTTTPTGILIIPIIILAGIITGGEYSIGTVRLLLTRGPMRTQFVLAKAITIIFCASIGFLLLNLFSILIGYMLHPISGLTPDFHFFTAVWFGHALLYLLIGILAWLSYAIIALFFATLGRSTVTGIVGGIIWLFMEPILTATLHSVISPTESNPVAKFLRSIPDYFISNNIQTLFQRQSEALKIDTTAIGGLTATNNTLSTQHTLLVLLAYMVVCIGLSCWLTAKRDITH